MVSGDRLLLVFECWSSASPYVRVPPREVGGKRLASIQYNDALGRGVWAKAEIPHDHGICWAVQMKIGIEKRETMKTEFDRSRRLLRSNGIGDLLRKKRDGGLDV